MGFTSIPIRNIIREAVARGGIIVMSGTAMNFWRDTSPWR